ncbi:MAG: lipid II flippase MurJ, partial [Actinomycetota bacterium]
AQERELGELLLLFFLPQIWLYGLGTVLTGVLHAHHRFAGPALAPLLSSVVVTASYLLYALVEGPQARQLGEISALGRMILGMGTTAGVATLSLSLLLPIRRLRLRWRPVLAIPEEARGITRRLLGSAVLAVLAQQVLLGVVLVIANAVEGGVVAYQLAFTILLFPWAVLAVPVASASFPGLSEAAALADMGRFGQRCAAAIRTLGLAVFGGAAALVATAAPGSRIIAALGLGGKASAAVLVPTISAFAPGLIGYGAYALLTRVAYALGDGRSPSLAAAAGFGLAAVGDLVSSVLLGGTALIAALAGAFSIGMIVAAGVLLLRLRRTAGSEAFAGLGVTTLRGLGAGGLSALAGSALARALPRADLWESLASCLAAALAAVLTYLVAQYLLGDRELARVAGFLRLNPRGRST